MMNSCRSERTENLHYQVTPCILPGLSFLSGLNQHLAFSVSIKPLLVAFLLCVCVCVCLSVRPRRKGFSSPKVHGKLAVPVGESTETDLTSQFMTWPGRRPLFRFAENRRRKYMRARFVFVLPRGVLRDPYHHSNSCKKRN